MSGPNRVFRLFGIVVIIVFVLLSLSWVALRVDSSREAQRAAQMVRDLSKLRLDRSTAQDAKIIVNHFHGAKVRYAPTLTALDVDCGDADESYAISITPVLAERFLSRLPILSRLGIIHDWSVEGAVQLKGNKLLCVTHTIAFRGSDARSQSALVAGSMRPDSQLAGQGNNTYLVSFEANHSVHVLYVRTFPGATEPEIATAFEPDLRCLTTARGCKYPCELAPSAWRDYLRSPDWQHLVLGYGKPADADDPRCAAIAAAH
jgi:hypothetical protein